MLSNRVKRLIGANEAELAGIAGNLLSAAKGREVKTVFVTSSRNSEGKTTAAIALAQSLAANGRNKVLLIDANLRSPRLHELFEVAGSPGLTDLFLGNGDESQVMRDTEYGGLTVLPYGSGASSVDAFKPEVLSQGLANLKSKFDYIVCDGDSVIPSSDAAMVAKHFDGIVFVVECEKTKWELLQAATEKIENIGGNILGVVLNKRRFYIPRGLYGRI
ncbi:MAG: CpsD/CapB family tyrosine-protein kinase [Lentisphaerae bacterium]|nr:CpsD/CapB family tyrosine-protein kinase [Lentisphaerota bacterium]